MKKYNFITKEFLLKEYIDNKKSPYHIAKEIGCDFWLVRSRLIKYKIKTRTLSEAQKERLKNPKNHPFFGKKRPEHGKWMKKLYSVPENTSRYIDGKWSKKHYCKCGQEISPLAKNCLNCHHEYIKKSEVLKNRKITWADKISKTSIEKGLSKGKNNPMFGKVTHGKWDKYQGINMRSSWEVAYAKWLDKNNVRWQYESKTFDLGDTTYTPDFYLPELDWYVEIKGYWREDAKEKFKLFKKHYSNVKIRVLMKPELEELGII